MLTAYVWIRCLALSSATKLRPHRLEQRGQASAEYALVLLGAAAIALLVMAWASRTDRIGRLLDSVVDTLLSRVR